MPSFEILLQAVNIRKSILSSESSSITDDLAAIDQEIADKRAEKTIAAQNEVKDLLKKKETLMQRSKFLLNAAKHVQLAFAKLNAVEIAGLQDWQELVKERLKLSPFAKEQLDQKSVMNKLHTVAGGGTLSIEGDFLVFAGASKFLDPLKKAVDALETSFSTSLEVEAEFLRFLESRGELKRFTERHEAEFSAEGSTLTISGSVANVRKAEKSVKFLTSGALDMPCPRNLVGAAKARAKEWEAETGTYIDVVRGTAGSESKLLVRGDAECVRDAEERVHAWLDESEGAYSAFVDISQALQRMEPGKVDTFSNDLGHLGNKFGILARLSQNRVELRGPQTGDWEKAARSELNMIVDFYAPPAKPTTAAAAKQKSKAKPAEKEPEDDTWGAAPEAEFDLGHKW